MATVLRGKLHVVPVGKGWGVKQMGKPDPVVTTRLQVEAMDEAAAILRQRQRGGDIILHGRDGRIRSTTLVVGDESARQGD